MKKPPYITTYGFTLLLDVFLILHYAYKDEENIRILKKNIFM